MNWAMLATNFDDVHIDYPVFVQPKLNGVRAKWDVDKQLLITRQGKVIPQSVLPNVYRDIKTNYHGQHSLDGELWTPALPFQTICGVVNGKRNEPHLKHALIAFACFDVISDDPAPRSTSDIPNVTGQYCHSKKHLNELLAKISDYAYYDGLILRVPGAPYIVGRTEALVKLKPWKHAIVEVVDFVEGEGKFANALGSFFVRLGEKFFNVGGGNISEVQRMLIWKYKDVKKVKIRYRDLSKSGVPLQPQIAAWSDL